MENDIKKVYAVFQRLLGEMDTKNYSIPAFYLKKALNGDEKEKENIIFWVSILSGIRRDVVEATFDTFKKHQNEKNSSLQENKICHKTISINENEFKTLVKKIVNESVKRVLKESSEDEGLLRNWFGRRRNAGQQQNMTQAQPNSMQQQNTVQAQPNSMQQGTGGKCPKCGNPIKQGASFCNQCGYNITGQAKFCRNCGAPINQGQNYCRKCGKPLGQKQNLQEDLKVFDASVAWWYGYYHAFRQIQEYIKKGQNYALKACRATQGQIRLLKDLGLEDPQMNAKMNDYYEGEIEGYNDYLDNNIEKLIEKAEKAFKVAGVKEKPELIPKVNN